MGPLRSFSPLDKLPFTGDGLQPIVVCLATPQRGRPRTNLRPRHTFAQSPGSRDPRAILDLRETRETSDPGVLRIDDGDGLVTLDERVKGVARLKGQASGARVGGEVELGRSRISGRSKE